MLDLKSPSEAKSPESHRLSLLSDRSIRRYQRHSSSENTFTQSTHQRPYDDLSKQPYHSVPSFEDIQTNYDVYGSGTPPEIRTPANHRAPGLNAVLNFLAHSPLIISALVLGFLGSLACFAFTYWLASNHFYCPPWSVGYTLNASAHYLGQRLGLVQGILSTIYGICVAGIVYATYELAEATLWPLLASHALSTQGIDRFLAHTRGSLASFPYAFWHTRRHTHVVTVLIVGIMGLMLQVNSTIIGWTFTVLAVPTTLDSLHTTGGGMGFGFSGQSIPPGVINGEVQRAATMYSAWSNSQAVETLPELRSFIMNRANFTEIGNFTVNAVNASTHIECYPKPVEFVGYGFDFFLVNVTVGPGANASTLGLRASANGFTSWVYNYTQLSNTRTVTTLMFAALNSTIEGGHLNHNEIIEKQCAEVLGNTCSGMSTLACDVDIDLVNSQACNGRCAANNDTGAITNVTWVGNNGIRITGDETTDIAGLTVAMAGAATQFGPYTLGVQPFFTLGAPLPNSTYALPIAFSDVETLGLHTVYSQANLTNFINVAIGAVATGMAQGWPGDPVLVQSTLNLFRLDRQRSFVLLAPPIIALLSVAFLAAMNVVLYNKAGLDEVRLGSTTELLLGASRGNAMQTIEEIQRRSDDKKWSLNGAGWRLERSGTNGDGRERGLNLDGSVVMVQSVKSMVVRHN